MAIDLKWRLLPALIGLALVLSGCGSSEEPQAHESPGAEHSAVAVHEQGDHSPDRTQDTAAKTEEHHPADEHHPLAKTEEHHPADEHHPVAKTEEHHQADDHHPVAKTEEHHQAAEHHPPVEHHQAPKPHPTSDEEHKADGHQDKAAEAAWGKLLEKVQGELGEEKFAEAAASLKEAMTAAGEDTKKQANCHQLEGQIKLAQGDLEAGVRAFRKTIALERSQEHPDYEMIASSLSTIGGVHYSKRKMGSAATLLLEAADLMEEHSPTEYAKRKAALANLAMIYASANQPKKVLEIKERLRLVAVEANEPLEEGAIASGWLTRHYKPGSKPHALRYAARHLPPDLSLAETRILLRRWPDPNAEPESGGH